MRKYIALPAVVIGLWISSLRAEEPKPAPKPVTIEQLQKQVADLTAQVAQRDVAIAQLRASIESWVKMFNTCMGDLVVAKTEKK